MILSRYTAFLPRDGFAWAVNTLTRTVLRVPERVPAFFAQCPDSSEDALRKEFGEQILGLLSAARFIVRAPDREIEEVRRRVTQESGDSRTFGMVIVPTLKCNCSCHYCFESQCRSTERLVAPQAIVHFAEQQIRGRKSFTLQWFGGEPLLHPDVVCATSDRVRTLCVREGVAFHAGVVTNGVLLNRENSRLLATVGISHCQITLDGDRKSHDRIRFDLAGKPTFDRILKNIRSAAEHLSIRLRVHVTPGNVDSILTLISELGAKDFGRFLDEIYFAPVFDYTTGRSARQFNHEGEKFCRVRSFAELEPMLYQAAKENSLPLPDIFDEGFDVCTAVRSNAIVVGPDGKLFKCYFDVGNRSEALGHLDSDGLDVAKLCTWNTFPLPRDEECESCRVLPLCLGGCTKKWHAGASKVVICDPLRYNLSEMVDVIYG